ncbi:MAG: MerR family transcriptional regulator [Ruminococcaceae bacterium]|nr:MerR family transcriptional regulator [Oscillospiraceae bacterium]
MIIARIHINFNCGGCAMKIKEAAQYCGLTEKAIRLYETKGLIHPKTEDKNGRTFREYDEETIRTLLTVGTLRRADFSMEQIGVMQNDPQRIPEIFAAYREEVRENAKRISALSRVLDSLESDEEITLSEFADRLAIAMFNEDMAPPLPTGDSVQRPVIRFHHYVWDEEGTPEEKEDAYRRFLQNQAKREKIEDVVFAVPRKIGAGWRWLRGKVDSRIRDENNKVKKTVKLAAVFLLICGMLLNGVVIANDRISRAQDGCTGEIFYAMREVIYTLRNTMATGEYTHGHSEYVIKNLTVIDREAEVAEFLYYNTYRRRFSANLGLSDLINAMGCTYSAYINGTAVSSILYDGTVSEKEFEFIRALLSDIETVYSSMLDEDGLNMREDLEYDTVRKKLNRFLDKWDEWNPSGEAPWELLNRFG